MLPNIVLVCSMQDLFSVLSHSQVSEAGDLLNVLVACTQVCEKLTIFANNHGFGPADIQFSGLKQVQKRLI